MRGFCSKEFLVADSVKRGKNRLANYSLLYYNFLKIRADRGQGNKTQRDQVI